MEEKESFCKEMKTKYGFDNTLAQLLIERGICNVEKAEDFLFPKIENLTDIDGYFGLPEVADRIEKAIVNDERIVIYGDYDCDGIGAVSILYLYLKGRGADVEYFIPNRQNDGFGLSSSAIEFIADKFMPDIVVSVDCGISSANEVEYAQELGIEIIITDHHEPTENIPNCLIFNPKLSKEGVFRDLCGAGVALRLVEKLGGLQESKKYYDIAAISTVADVVPLLSDNRIIVSLGLKLINLGYRRGIKLLVNSCCKDNVNSTDIAFKIAPRINSVGRLGDALKVVGLFCEEDNFLLECLVNEINKTNDERMKQTESLSIECMSMLEGYDFENFPIIVLYKKDWNEGILGITASRIVSIFNRPTILLTKGKNNIKGSGRSVDGVNILDCVSAGADFLSKFGGHKMACGLSLGKKNSSSNSLNDEENDDFYDIDEEDDFEMMDEVAGDIDDGFDEIANLQNFVSAINCYCKAHYSVENFMPKNIEGIALDDEDMLDISKKLAYFEPFGEGNKEPLFCKTLKNEKFSRIGETEHIKCKENDSELVVFGGLKNIKLYNSASDKKVSFELKNAIFRNIEYAQGIVRKTKFTTEEAEDITAFVASGIYENKSIFYPKTCNIDEILTKKSDYGDCYIAYTTKTCDEFKENYFNHYHYYPVVANCDFDEKCPYNTLILNPRINVNMQYFKRVIFLDAPISLGVIDEMLLSAKCEVFICGDKHLDEIKKFLPTYQKLGENFVKIRDAVDEKKYFNEFELYCDVYKILPQRYEEFAITLYIFIDLGIVNFDKNGIMINRGVSNKLANSRLYQNLVEA